MRSNKAITTIANGIYAEAIKGIDTLVEVKKDVVAGIDTTKVDAGLAIISSLSADIEAILKAPQVDGVGLPQYLSKVVAVEDSLETITVRVSSKLKAPYKYRKDTVVEVGENLVKDMATAYIDALFDMYYIEQAIENVDVLNAKIAEIISENEIPFEFSFAVNTDTDAVVLEIDDNRIVLNANITRAHDIANLGIFREGNEYNDLIREEAIADFVNSLKAVQTPVQLIKSNISLIKDVTGLSTKKRASKLIRESYHRQAKYLKAVKTGVGYYNETVKIGDEDVDVFALVEKTEDGDLSLILSPFNVKDLYSVDYDVIAAVKAQLA